MSNKCNQVLWSFIDSMRECEDNSQRGLMLTLLKFSNEGPVDTRPMRQLLLAQTHFFPQMSQLCCERFC